MVSSRPDPHFIFGAQGGFYLPGNGMRVGGVMSPGYRLALTVKSEAEGVGRGSQFDQILGVKGGAKAHLPLWGAPE